eukprot:scaffold225868_cov35-Tisochrysis_lutea.AAC.1
MGMAMGMACYVIRDSHSHIAANALARCPRELGRMRREHVVRFSMRSIIYQADATVHSTDYKPHQNTLALRPKTACHPHIQCTPYPNVRQRVPVAAHAFAFACASNSSAGGSHNTEHGHNSLPTTRLLHMRLESQSGFSLSSRSPIASSS